MKSGNQNIDAARQVVDPQHPWLGLKAYTEGTQAYFFGRNTAINELFTRVRETRLTTLFGQSGLGKTSLLGAGLLPKLKVEGYLPRIIRLDYSKGAPSLIEQTRLALCELLSIAPKKPDATLWELLHHIDSRQKELQQSLPVLIFDQFEEIFNLAASRQSEVTEWFTQIADLVENRPPASLQEIFRHNRQQARAYDTSPSPVRIVIALREDYLSHLERWKGLMPSLMRNRMALHPLTGIEALEAVTGPGGKGKKPIVSVQVGEQIVRKVARQPESIPMEQIRAVPPFLSLLCEQLNAARLKSSDRQEHITSGLVTSLGDNILDKYYEESFTNLPDALRLFVEERLVSPSGHRNTLTLEDAENEMLQAGVQNVRQLIDALISRRLLNAEERNGIIRLELTHDLLTSLVVHSRTTRREKEALLKARQQRQRQFRIVMGAGVVIMLLATLAGFGWYYYQEADKAKSEALKTLKRLSRIDFIHGSDYLEEGQAAKGIAYLCHAIQTDSLNRSAVARLYSALVYPTSPIPVPRTMQHHGPVRSAQFSPDGYFIVTASRDSTAQVWDARSGKPLSQPMKHRGQIHDAQFSPHGHLVLTASQDSTAQVWNVQSGKPLSQPMRHRGPVHSAEFSPDGRFVLTASRDNTAMVWDARSGKPLSQPMRHRGPVHDAHFSPDGRFVLTASRDNTAMVWDARSGKPLFQQPIKHEKGVNSAQFSPDGRFVVTASNDNTAKVWNARSGKPLSQPMRHQGPVHDAQFSPCGRFVVTASRDNTARVWNAQSGEPLSEPMKHEGGVRSAQFSPDGRLVLSASFDKSARIWDAQSGKPVSQPLTHQGPVHSAQFSPDGRLAVTASFIGNAARIWSAQNGKPKVQHLSHRQSVISAQLNTDGLVIITSSADSTAHVWNVKTGKSVASPLQHKQKINSAVFSSNGQLVITASSDNTAQVWDAKTGNPVAQSMKHHAPVLAAHFSPNDKLVVTVSADSTTTVWNAKTGKSFSLPLKHNAPILAVQFSPDGHSVITVSADNTTRVWNTKTGKPASHPLQYQGTFRSAQFSPDGQFIVTASADNAARIWDTKTGKPVSQPLQHQGPILAAPFSPDGQFVVTASADKTARVWDTKTGKPVSQPLQHQEPVSSAQFSPDGRRLITVSKGNVIKIWDILPKGDDSIAPALAHFGQAVSQMQINDMGGEEKISADEFLQLSEWTEKNANTPVARQLANWLLTPIEKRTPSPFME